MKKLHRVLVYALSASALCSCATGGNFQSNGYINGRMMRGSNWSDAHFYMDEGELAPVLSPNYMQRPSGLYCCGPCPYTSGIRQAYEA